MKTFHSWSWGQNMKFEIGSRGPEDLPDLLLYVMVGASGWAAEE